jgi:hypothetical protein
MRFERGAENMELASKAMELGPFYSIRLKFPQLEITPSIKRGYRTGKWGTSCPQGQKRF